MGARPAGREASGKGGGTYRRGRAGAIFRGGIAAVQGGGGRSEWYTCGAGRAVATANPGRLATPREKERLAPLVRDAGADACGVDVRAAPNAAGTARPAVVPLRSALGSYAPPRCRGT